MVTRAELSVLQFYGRTGTIHYSLPFSSIHLRHSSRCASPFDVSKPIWVYMVVHAMLLPCLGTPADAVRLFPSWYGSRVEPFFPL
jgi:hypothetical protein